MRLKDKVAVITGAASGIGHVTAGLFAEEGATVVAVDINEETGNEVVTALRQRNHAAHFVETDISKESDAERLAAEVVKVYGRIDILINSAAIFVLKGVDATPEEWRLSVDVNIIGTALVTKHVAEPMKRVAAPLLTWPLFPALLRNRNFMTYSATKVAILQMTRNMALDLAPYHIGVNAVCPGTILTPGVGKYMADRGMTLDQLKTQRAPRHF